jgi:hypothetical protein
MQPAEAMPADASLAGSRQTARFAAQLRLPEKYQLELGFRIGKHYGSPSG